MSSADTLVYDMSQMTDKAAPSVFVKRDWLSILDSQNGNYNGNQLVIDTSQLSNSNKYMSYRQAYLSVPLVMAVSSPKDASGNSMLDASGTAVLPDMGSSGRAFGLKSWYGSIINSMVLDYAGTTIIQQTSLCGMWNCFTLMTSLSLSDIELNGVTLGFFPDDVNFCYEPTASTNGIGCCNNRLQVLQGTVQDPLGQTEFSNSGMWRRMADSVLLPESICGQGSGTALSYGEIVPEDRLKSYYRSLLTSSADSSATTGQQGHVYAIQAQIFLKHIHSFFANCPLMKGVFFRLTLNLNQPVLTLSGSGGALDVTQIISPLGGIVPVMVASQSTTLLSSGSETEIPSQSGLLLTSAAGALSARVTLNVGNRIIDPTQSTNIAAAGLSTTTSLNQSCQLYIPAYTFNPSYEEAYLSRPTKRIQYTDIYQFTTAGVPGAGSFNFLITNGISNVKSVLVLPFFSKIAASRDFPPFQSPFDPAGCGPTSPLTSVITNFNVVVAGQNMIYNTQNYGFEEFINQFVGVNSINGNQTDGLTSGLVDFHKWNQSYCYWYVDCSRMLSVDEAVPKSISIQGTNGTAQAGGAGDVKFYVFVEYGVEVSLDVLTGARV